MSEEKSTYTGRPSQRMEDILKALSQEDAHLSDPTTLSPEQGRALAEQANKRWNQDLPAVKQIDFIEFSGDTGHLIKAQLFTPKTVNPGLILFIHGGGFAFCNTQSHERFIRLLSIESQCSILSIDYRLAPEHPFPSGLNDCISVLNQLSKVHDAFPWTRGVLAISGDSAGANLALATIFQQQSQSGINVVPDFGLLFYGVFTADFNTTSYQQFSKGPGLTREKMMRYMDWYADAKERNNPLVAPIRASDEMLMRLPPLYLNSAEIDPLCSDSELLAARLEALGRQDQLDIISGVVHGFLQMTLRLPAACRATTEAANAFRQFAGHQTKNTTTRNTP